MSERRCETCKFVEYTDISQFGPFASCRRFPPTRGEPMRISTPPIVDPLRSWCWEWKAAPKGKKRG